MDEQQPRFALAPACRRGNVFACAKFPNGRALLPQVGLADAISPDQIFVTVNAAGLLRSDGNTTGTGKAFPAFGRIKRVQITIRSPPTGLQPHG